MADTVPITAGSGTIIGTDEVTIGGTLQHVQRVKLVDGSDGGTALIGGDATNGLDVDVTRIIPGTTATALGKAEDAAHADADVGVMMLGVRNYAGPGTDGDYSALAVSGEGDLYVRDRPDLVRIAVTSGGLTIATTAYTAGDQLGSQFTFANAVNATGGFGRIIGGQIISAADIIGPIDLVLTRASVTLAADNAAYAISDADALNFINILQFAGAYDIGNNRVLQMTGPPIYFDVTGTSLFGGLITRAGHTFFAAVTDLQVNLIIERLT